MVSSIALALSLLSSLAGALVAQVSNGATTTTAGSISGRVTDALGEGVPMADVSVLGWSDRDRRLARGITDASGMFVIRGVPLRDSPYWLDVVAADRQGGLAVARLSETARESWTEIRVWDAATVDVLVVGEDGRPVGGASVFARSRFDRLFVARPGPQVETRTDATGHARLADVPIGAIVVGAWCSGHDLANTSLHLTRGAQVEFRLAEADGARLDLAVVGLAAGTEVAWDLSSPADRDLLLPRSLGHGTTRDGKAAIAGLPDAKWLLRLAAPGHGLWPSQIELEPGEAVHEVRVTATPSGTVEVRGTLRDASGKPLADRTLGP